jgi:4-azaleucine resistance transporter AzlC
MTPDPDARDASPRRAFVDGALAVAPLLVGVAPFGLILGVAAAASAIGMAAGWATSPIIFGGAAQLVTIELTNAGAAAAVVVATALVVNARHLMYSAALADHFRTFPTPWRYGLPYLMTDQAFAVSITRYGSTDDPVYKRWFFLGAGIGLWAPWQVTTATGALLGAQVPGSWSLDFAIPLVFMVLLILAVKDRPGFVAAAVGGVASVAGRGIPYRLGLIVAAVIGIAAGVIAGRRRS